MKAGSRRLRSQAGTTLVELLVATVIMGLTLSMLIGMFSTGAIDSTLAKRDVAARAATEYELEKIQAMPYNPAASGYSDCFAGGAVSSGACSSSNDIQADVSVSPASGASSLQQWTIRIIAGSTQVGSPVSTYKVNR